MPTPRSLLLALACAAALLAACEKKVTGDALNQIQDGMSLNDVAKIMGGSGTKEAKAEGTSLDGGGTLSNRGNASTEDTYVWKDGSKEIVVTFRDGKVVNKVGRGL